MQHWQLGNSFACLKTQQGNTLVSQNATPTTTIAAAAAGAIQLVTASTVALTTLESCNCI